MAAPQLERFFRQLQGALPLSRMQQQDALAVQAGIAKPGLCQARRRRHQGQPARVLILAQLTQDRCQQVQAVAGGATQSQFAECLIILPASDVIRNQGRA